MEASSPVPVSIVHYTRSLLPAIIIQYDFVTHSWTPPKTIHVRVQRYIGQGGMRVVYGCQVEGLDGEWVMKWDIEHSSDLAYEKDIVERDARMQAICQDWARRFSNEVVIDKKIRYVEAYVAILRSADGHEFYTVIEESLVGKGPYVKYNSNDGDVLTDHNTPQAFSHYSFEKSDGKILIVDIQGVDTAYTDPQVHSYIGTGFGDGDHALDGLTWFFATHRCNRLCEALGLPNRAEKKVVARGTRAASLRRKLPVATKLLPAFELLTISESGAASDSSLLSRLDDILITEPDLTRAEIAKSRAKHKLLDFTGMSLSGLNLARLNLIGLCFRSTDLTKTNFQDAIMNTSNFVEAQMVGTAFTGAELAGSDFSRAVLSLVNFESAKLTNCIFSGATFRDVKLPLRLENCNFSGCDFTKTPLRGITCHNVTFTGAQFDCTNLPIEFDHCSDLLFKAQNLELNCCFKLCRISVEFVNVNLSSTISTGCSWSGTFESSVLPMFKQGICKLRCDAHRRKRFGHHHTSDSVFNSFDSCTFRDTTFSYDKDDCKSLCFSKCSFENVVLPQTISGWSFIDCPLTDVVLPPVITNCSFEESTLEQTDFSESTIFACHFKEITFRSVKFPLNFGGSCSFTARCDFRQSETFTTSFQNCRVQEYCQFICTRCRCPSERTSAIGREAPCLLQRHVLGR
eukprot:GILJ01007040.1.p1 GENE.GILJ01007040.1~~GILJ01007040.1.p1  ORF type:complete len:704 (-),score=29.21 GILJ01007040.1:359-2413(-)